MTNRGIQVAYIYACNNASVIAYGPIKLEIYKHQLLCLSAGVSLAKLFQRFGGGAFRGKGIH